MQPRIQTTRWTLVVRASSFDQAERKEALSSLRSQNWYPLYYFVRRSGKALSLLTCARKAKLSFLRASFKSVFPIRFENPAFRDSILLSQPGQLPNYFQPPVVVLGKVELMFASPETNPVLTVPPEAISALACSAQVSKLSV